MSLMSKETKKERVRTLAKRLIEEITNSTVKSGYEVIISEVLLETKSRLHHRGFKSSRDGTAMIYFTLKERVNEKET